MLIPINDELPNDARVWIFGYGSLIWKPGFKYTRRVLGFVKGFGRRFWQTNTTHRGTLDQPGRVATLVPDQEGTVWGLAYEVVGLKNIKRAMAHLNGREITCGGYNLILTDFHPEGEIDRPLPVLAFTATASNKHYNMTSLSELARQVVTAEGPAGHNVEYVLRIVDFMTEHVGCEHDKHLWELNGLIRTLLKERDIVVKHLVGDGPICDCYSAIHRKKCPSNHWALDRDVMRTVVTCGKQYTDLNELFVKAFSSSSGAMWDRDERDSRKHVLRQELDLIRPRSM